MTSTGPFVLSGAAAGVSVEGPMASVSARLRLEGGAGFTNDEGAGSVLSEGLVSVEGGVESVVWAVVGVSDSCAVVFADAGVAAEAGSVLISTGLDDSAS